MKVLEQTSRSVTVKISKALFERLLAMEKLEDELATYEFRFDTPVSTKELLSK